MWGASYRNGGGEGEEGRCRVPATEMAQNSLGVHAVRAGGGRQLVLLPLRRRRLQQLLAPGVANSQGADLCLFGSQVGTISANGEREIGDLIARAMEKVGGGGEGVHTVGDGEDGLRAAGCGVWCVRVPPAHPPPVLLLPPPPPPPLLLLLLHGALGWFCRAGRSEGCWLRPSLDALLACRLGSADGPAVADYCGGCRLGGWRGWVGGSRSGRRV